MCSLTAGGSADTDIYPTTGDVYFVSNAIREYITVNIKLDNTPEGTEVGIGKCMQHPRLNCWLPKQKLVIFSDYR